MKNLILDLGGVLYDLNYQATLDALNSLGWKTDFSRTAQSHYMDLFEEGKISKESFADEIIRESSKNIERIDVYSALNAMLIGVTSDKFELLEELKNRYNLLLFSNTNELHIAEVYKHFKTVHNLDNLNDYFQRVYLSHELGIRKPKPEGFDLICRENSFNKEETLFIDDSPQHAEGARKAGIQGEWLDLSKEDIHQMVDRLNLL